LSIINQQIVSQCFSFQHIYSLYIDYYCYFEYFLFVEKIGEMHSPKNDDDDDLLVIDDDSTNSNFNLAGREDFTIGNSGGDIEAEIEGYNSPKQDNNDIAGTSSNTIINFISTSSEAEMITNFNLPGEQNGKMEL
jgi:hypothetical protein